MAVFSIVGIGLAAGARDDGMYVFGWSLAAFAVLFIADLVRQAFAHAAVAPPAFASATFTNAAFAHAATPAKVHTNG